MNIPNTLRGHAPEPTPTAAELAAEEAALQAMAPAEPLSRRQIGDLVTRALRAPAPRTTRFGRHWLVAVLVTVSLVSLGWIGARLVWPKETLAPLSLSYADAVVVATDLGRNEAVYAAALLQIDEFCGYGAGVLKRLANAGEPDLANRSVAILTELSDLLGSEPTQPPARVDADFLERARTVEDRSRPLAERTVALEQIGQLMRSGLTAVLVSRQVRLSDPASLAKAEYWITRLREDLRR